jgi:hypothetical protein
VRPDERSGPPAQVGRPKVTPPSSTATSIPDPGICNLEWRISWRRAAWAPTTWSKSRTFTRHADAMAFLAKLNTPRPDLSAPTIHFHHRRVGPWSGGWPQ